MGDYTKLIVHAEVKVPKEELEAKVKEMGLYESAYHCGGVIESIEPRSQYNGDYFFVTLVGQTKWGGGQREFLDWLAPHVVKGSGQKGIWAFQIDEYCLEPSYRSLRPDLKDEY